MAVPFGIPTTIYESFNYSASSPGLDIASFLKKSCCSYGSRTAEDSSHNDFVKQVTPTPLIVLQPGFSYTETTDSRGLLHHSKIRRYGNHFA